MDKKKNILVIEDEDNLMQIIEQKLIASGFNVLTAKTADGAMEIIKSGGKIDLIWLDHYLPKKNGLELTIRLKYDIKYSDIPIFLISNSTDVKDLYVYVNLGINKYYVKADNTLQDIINDIQDFFAGKTDETINQSNRIL